MEEAVAEASACYADISRLIIADYADNPGGGGYGDATGLLGAMIAADLKDACFGPIVDPETAAVLRRAEPGVMVSVELGGKVDPAIGARASGAHRHGGLRERRRLGMSATAR